MWSQLSGSSAAHLMERTARSTLAVLAWTSSTRLNYVYLILKWCKLCFHGNCVGKMRLIGGS
jgi:hypothetical protein